MTDEREPKTYLFSWNPDGYEWPSEKIAATKAALADGPVADNWSTGNTTSAHPGDRFFLLRLGQEPRGIFGAGRVTSKVRQALHWDPARAAKGDTYNQVDIEIEELLNPWEEKILDHATLARLLPDVSWSPQASGTSVPVDAVGPLHDAWRAVLSGERPVPRDFEEAKRLCEELLPDVSLRSQILLLIAETIERAAEQGVLNWEATLRPPAVAVNTGHLQALTMNRRGLYIGVDERLVKDAALREMFDSEPGYLKRMPSGVWALMPFEKVPEFYARFREAHLAFIKETGALRCPYRRHHSFGLIRYISEETGKDLPDPDVPLRSRKQQYWKLSPERDAVLWPEWREQEYASIGWNELGDLAEVTKDEFDQRVTDVLKRHPEWKRAGLQQVWHFRGIKPGDRIVANKGTTQVLGIGTVTGDYYFDAGATDPHGGHRVPVTWDDTRARAVDKGGWRRTLIKLKRPEFQEILDDVVRETEPPPPPLGDEAFPDILAAIENEGLYFPKEVVANFLLALQTKRFVIFTGISGTGKTQLALAVAKHFGAGEVDADDGSAPPAGVEVTIKPSMVKYSRMVIPAALATEFLVHHKPTDETRWLPIELPTGEGMNIGAYTKEGSSLLYALFSAEARAWVQSKQVGDRVWLSRLPEPEPIGTLRFAEHSDHGDTEASTSRGGRYAVIAVRPDWSDNTGLLGFFNPLTGKYTTRSFLRLALSAHEEWKASQAEERPAEPFFAILDEMNLARVEHYFSDLLSAMESGEPIELHDDDATEEGETEDGLAIPKRLVLPPNLFLVGTVNVDETTYMFSPKVLDRAFTIEFNDVALDQFGTEEADDTGTEDSPITLDKFDGTLTFRQTKGVDAWKAFGQLLDGELRSQVLKLNQLLERENRHFGYRVAKEIARFVNRAAEQTTDTDEAARAAFDLTVLQKVLPKLHGTQQELEEVLVELFRFAMGVEVGDPEEFTLIDGVVTPKAPEMSVNPPLPRTARKLWRMCRRLRQRGFASFIE